MIFKIKSFVNIGLDGYEVIVEATKTKALPTIEIIGLPDAAVKESKERIRSTFRSANLALPNVKFVLNLAPSDLRKGGTSFDLPMAMSILGLVYEDGLYHKDLLQEGLFFGELGLDGEVKRTNGILTMILAAKKMGYKHFFVPQDNLYELEYISDIHIYPISSFSQLVNLFVYNQDISHIYNNKNLDDLITDNRIYEADFGDIRGQLFAKRALSIAATGMHNIMMLGAPGSGKTLLARALQSILPPLDRSEIMEVSQIYSIVGKLDKNQPLIVHRPFRSIHHTASRISIIGGSSNLTPGEISMAHRGILFMDELAEFPRDVLDVLRQPIEDKKIVINRVSGSITYPASFMLVAAMNPCKCGYYKDPQKDCKCTMNDITRYQSRVSGPILDRIDMILEIPRENIDKILEKQSGESSESIRHKVIQARQIQQNRYADSHISTNSQISSKDIHKYITMSPEAESFLSKGANTMHLSPRVVHRIMKLARSIADMEATDIIGLSHIAEAFQYRNKNMFVEND